MAIPISVIPYRSEAYLAYRSASHQLALQHLPGVVDAGQFADEREAVRACWRELFGDAEAGEDDKETTGERNEPG